MKTTQLKLLTAVLLTATTFAAQAADRCYPLVGALRLDMDPTCQVATEYPGNAFLKAPNTCHRTTVTGLGKGFSGLTVETVFGADQGHTMTPGSANEQQVPPVPDGTSPIPYTRRFFTGRTIIKSGNDALYGADAGVMGAKGLSEQILLVGGTGRFNGASGHIYAFGNYLGNWGAYIGELCLPR
ncbi:hypothetical protein HNQ59_000181 [Chitinivorax tropicus]|uniref:Porin n=1 Tax=Chitinivorax tropicus TaxID=714531 RepID=A0A840MIA3_9PROT|nr:hypothetical protein [Chitinivorax tropicus]MBB5016919.1 hypothetical protein [Chitinivorax tropicus]